METLFQDLRYGMRMLRKHPGFTAVAVLTLALSIGANTAIFSVVNSVLLRPLNFFEPERLFVIKETNPQQNSDQIELSYPNLLDLQSQSKSFEEIAAYGFVSAIMSRGDGPVRVSAMPVSANIFPMLRATAAEGRTFLPEEDKPGGNPVVVVSNGFARRYFGNESAVGKSLTLNDKAYTVVGVMRPDFRLPDETMDVWMPVGPDTDQPFLRNRAVHVLYGLARLKSGVSQGQAAAELATIFNRIQLQHPGEDAGHTAKVTPLRDAMVGQAKPALLVLLGAVAFVLLIACANVANLLLARAAARQKEMAIRKALGAGRWRVIRQLLTESLLVSVMGGALVILIAVWGMRYLVAQLPAWFPHVTDIGVDGSVLLFSAALTLLTGVAFGLAPAFQSARGDVNESLKEGGKASIGLGRSRLRQALVVAEISLSLVLLIGAGLMIKSFWRLTNVNPGFQSDHLLTMNVSLPERGYTSARVIYFYQQIPQKLSTLPGVKAVSAVNLLPISGGEAHGELTIESRPFAPGEAPGVSYRRILPNYFRVMGVPLLQGRDFDDRDTGGKPDVVIINQKMARRYWPDADAVGKRIKVGPTEGEPWLTVVGVVGDVNHAGLDAEPDLATYEPHGKRPWSEMSLLVRTNSDPLATASSVQSLLKSMEKEILVEKVNSMEQRLYLSVAPQRLNLILLATFGLVALMLAAIGIYGVMAYTVSQRTREIGIRMALGARTEDVLKLVVRNGMSLALVGALVGLAGSYGLTRLMRSLLFGVTPTDPMTFSVVTASLLLVAFLACYLPARRATKVDPLIALRYE